MLLKMNLRLGYFFFSGTLAHEFLILELGSRG